MSLPKNAVKLGRLALGLSPRAAAAAAPASFAPGKVRRYAIVTAAGIGAAKAATGAGAAAAGGGALLRLLGVDIGWPAIVGASMAAAFGAYAWGTKKIADADRGPLKAEIHKVCCLPSGVTMTNHLGQKIDIASVLRGHHAILSFGTVHSAGTPNLLERVGRAAQTAKQKTGKFIVPVFISLDPGHDTAALNTAVGRAGSPDMMALTGPPDALLGCVERFKNTILAKVVAAEKSDVKFKKAADVRTDAGFASDHVYVVDEKGNFITIMPKELGSEEMGRYLVEEVQRSSEKG